MVTERPTQAQGLISGFLGGNLSGFLLGLLTARPVGAEPGEPQWDRLIQLEEAQLAALAKLVAFVESFAAGEIPVNITAQMKPGMIFVPLDPEGLNGAIQAMRLKGLTQFPMTRLAWNNPAGVTTNFTLTLPANYIDTRRLCQLTSDFYDPNIAVNIFVDETLTTPQGVALTGPVNVDFGEFYVKTMSVRFNTVNGAAGDAMLSLEIVPSLMEKSFYETFYAPIMDYMHKSLQEVASGEV